jgi:hypothetical protein
MLDIPSRGSSLLLCALAVVIMSCILTYIYITGTVTLAVMSLLGAGCGNVLF